MVTNHEAANTLKGFTIGPNNPIKMRDYADFIAKKIGWTGTINWNTRPHRPGEIYYLSSKNDRLTSILDWKPTTTLDEGIDKTINLWKNQ